MCMCVRAEGMLCFLLLCFGVDRVGFEGFQSMGLG